MLDELNTEAQAQEQSMQTAQNVGGAPVDAQQPERPENRETGWDWTPEQKAVIERLIVDRLERERRKIRREVEAETRKQLEDELAKAKMEDTDRLKLELQERDQKLQQYEYRLADLAVRAEARLQALALGVKPERVEYLVKLLDLTQIPVENGQVDKQAVQDAINDVLTRIPELRGQPAPAQAGAEFKTTQHVPGLTEEQIAQMSPEEFRQRMPEILAFYQSKRR